MLPGSAFSLKISHILILSVLATTKIYFSQMVLFYVVQYTVGLSGLDLVTTESKSTAEKVTGITEKFYVGLLALFPEITVFSIL